MGSIATALDIPKSSVFRMLVEQDKHDMHQKVRNCRFTFIWQISYLVNGDNNAIFSINYVERHMYMGH